MKDALIELTSSKKAIVMSLAIVATVILASVNRITGPQAIDFVKWVVITWIGAQAYQDANKPPTPPVTV